MSKRYASAVIKMALAEVGYYGKKNNNNLNDKDANKGGKYNKYAHQFDTEWKGFYNGAKNGANWCDVFVDWCLCKTFGVDEGRKALCQPEKSLGAGVDYSAGYYKKAGRWFTSPQKGDQIFFGKSEDMTHTGLVVDVDKDYVHTVEGNIGDPCHVGKKKYKLNASNIVGYGRPMYDTEDKKVIKFGVVSGEIKFKTTIDVLALRSKAQLASGKRFFYIPKGTKVKVVQEAICEADGYIWDCIIADLNGKEFIGYSAAKYLK